LSKADPNTGSTQRWDEEAVRGNGGAMRELFGGVKNMVGGGFNAEAQGGESVIVLESIAW